MVYQLFAHCSILITTVLMCSQIMNIMPLRVAKIRGRIFLGLIMGALGYSINVSGTWVNITHLVLILAAIYGGLPGIVSATLVILIKNIALLGTEKFFTSPMYFLISVSIIIMCFTKILKYKTHKMLIVNTICTAVISLEAYFSMYNSHYVVEFSIFIFASLSTGMIIFHIINNIYLLQSRYKNLSHQVNTDFLTGLKNVRYFHTTLSKLKSMDKIAPVSLILIDIDHFKSINDTYGHDMGDMVLKEMGVILSQIAKDGTTPFRNGGEEFSMLVMRQSHMHALHCAERVRQMIERHRFVLPSGKNLDVTISVGVASYPHTVKKIDDLMKQADNALYKAKRTGRNKVQSAV